MNTQLTRTARHWRWTLLTLLAVALQAGLVFGTARGRAFTRALTASMTPRVAPAPAPTQPPTPSAPPAQTEQSGTLAKTTAPTGVIEMPRMVLPGGGEFSTGGNFNLGASVGQNLTEQSSGGQFTLASGFWPDGEAANPTPTPTPPPPTPTPVPCPVIVINPAALPVGVMGTAYNQLLNASGGLAPYGFTVLTGSLPGGLTLSPAGALAGTPAAAGTFTFTVRALDARACAGAQAFTLTINNPASCGTLTLTPATLPGGTVGTAYNQTVTATDGTAPYTFTVAQGALPPGLSLSSTGTLSGTPTQGGSFTFTLRATDASGCTGTRLYALSLSCVTLTFSPATLPNATAGAPYNQTITVTPAATYTFSLLLGQLPPGFTLSQTGELSGLTTVTGTFNFTVKAVAGSCQGTKSYTLTVSAAALRATAAALAMSGDYDGDGKADPVLWAANTGAWRIVRSGNQQAVTQSWGTAGDVTLFGDYDGDGKSDLAVFRPSEGTFYVKRSSDGSVLTKAWGLGTDVPVPGDYDSDGKTDIAVWRGGEGNWYIVRSSDGMIDTVTWGTSAAPYNDVAVPGDYDGDGRTDVAVFRRSTGTWFIKRSSDGQFIVKAWGLATDVPVAGDYDGDGKTDIAVWRGAAGAWYIWQSATGSARAESWGTAAAPYLDQAAPADYDGDGQADLAVWRQADATWYVKASGGPAQTRAQGQAGDVPVRATRP